MDKRPTSFSIDSSAILYLAQMGPDHTNVYRFTAEMAEPIDADRLQQAADRIYRRFPTIFAGFLPGKRFYTVVPAQHPPAVREDPGLLQVMTREEIESCAYRIFYSGRQIIIEAFHALTDGYGAVASLKALLGEYVYLKYGVDTQEREPLLEQHPQWEEELRDVYPDHSRGKPGFLPQAYAYQMIRRDPSSRVHTSMRRISTRSLREAAKRNGVSVTSMLSELMAEAIMEFQHRYSTKPRKQPVRIMVPVDLRHHFPSRTLRNFILYALPTLKAGDIRLPRKERFFHFQAQLKRQTDRELLQAQISRNVNIQNSVLFRVLPLGWKCALMRLSYRFFGETNSSITLTNLGPVNLSGPLGDHVSGIHVHLMPRRFSPYNCALLSCGDVTSITITRFGLVDELEQLFFDLLYEVLETK